MEKELITSDRINTFSIRPETTTIIKGYQNSGSSNLLILAKCLASFYDPSVIPNELRLLIERLERD